MSAARVSTNRAPARSAARASGRAVPRSPRAAAARSRALLWALALAGWIFRRPVPVLVAVAVTGIVASIGWNVLMRQTARHPAPLFAKSDAARRPEPAPIIPPAAAPLPAPRPAAVTASPPAPPAAPAAERPHRPDAIGALIRNGEPARTDAAKPEARAEPRSEPKAEARSEPRPEPRQDPRVATVQVALSRLNYGPLKSDGLIGAGTKAAIERFERDRNLPVTGTLSPRTLRALAQQSGIEIE